MSQDELLDFSEHENRKVKHRNFWVLLTVILHFITILGAYAYSRIEIKSIVFSGIIFAVLSIVLLLMAVFSKRLYLLFQATIGLAMVVFVFAFIAFYELSPSESREPVPQLLSYLSGVFVIPVGISLIKEFRLPKR